MKGSAASRYIRRLTTGSGTRDIARVLRADERAMLRAHAGHAKYSGGPILDTFSFITLVIDRWRPRRMARMRMPCHAPPSAGACEVVKLYHYPGDHRAFETRARFVANLGRHGTRLWFR